MVKKILFIIMLVVAIYACNTTVFAACDDEPTYDSGCDASKCADSEGNLLDAMICQGSAFENSGESEGIGDTLSEFVYDDIFDAVFAIGNLIFAAITVILGVKYIWSGAEGKASVQESLPTFVMAVVFFYLAGPLLSFILEVTMDVQTASNWDELSGSFIWIINTIVKYLALAGIIFMGVRYLLASAEGKASLKTSMSGVVIGLLFVFLSTNVVNFIVEAGKDIL